MYLTPWLQARVREDPVTRELLAASVPELGESTPAAGESLEDFLADASSYDAQSPAKIPLRGAVPAGDASPDRLIVSSTRSCVMGEAFSLRVSIRRRSRARWWDPVPGEVVRGSRAAEGTEVDPHAWWDALNEAWLRPAGWATCGAHAGGQQHGMVVLDERGEVIRPALLWNDTRRGARLQCDRGARGGFDGRGLVGRCRFGSFRNVKFWPTKLRWLADHEPDGGPSAWPRCACRTTI